MKRYVAFLLLAGCMFSFSSCTSDSSPENGEEKSYVESKSSVVSDTSLQNTESSEEAAAVQSSAENSEAKKEIITVWKEGLGDPVSLNYSQGLESGVMSYNTTDADLLKELTEALKKSEIEKPTEERVLDDSQELTFTFEDESTYFIKFEGKGFLYNNDRYIINNASEVQAALDKIKQASVKDGTAKEYNEWIVNMARVEERVSHMCSSDEYENADTEKKRELALELLRQLESDGLITKGSIYSSDEMISYQYSGGGTGGIQLTQFDPYMN